MLRLCSLLALKNSTEVPISHTSEEGGSVGRAGEKGLASSEDGHVAGEWTLTFAQRFDRGIRGCEREPMHCELIAVERRIM